MYLQITTRCNMSCEHCGFDCKAEGEDMSMEVFRAAVGVLDSESISIGGGEPTLHPNFWEILGLCLGKYGTGTGQVWLATNGSNTEIAVSLAKMASTGTIACDLSRSQYHDGIDQEVVKAFEQGSGGKIIRWNSQGTSDMRNITGERESLIIAGRATSEFLYNQGIREIQHSCICPGIIVKPNGDIMGCGCADAPRLGNILGNYFIPHDYDWYGCCKDMDMTPCWITTPIGVTNMDRKITSQYDMFGDRYVSDEIGITIVKEELTA